MAAVLRGVFGYCFLVFIVRIVGRRPGKQLSPFEFVLVFFMGGITLTPMIGQDRSLTNALVTIMSIGLAHFVIAWLKQISPAFGRLVDGTPVVLVEKGKWQNHTMQKTHIPREDVMAIARDQGLERPEEIDYAILERSGEISVIAAGENS